MKLLSKECRILPCLSYASGSSDRVSKVIDTKGFNTVTIVVHHAAVHDSAVLDVFLQEADAASDADTLTSGADLAGTSQTIAGTADNTVTVIEVNKPLKRFLQLAVNNDASNATAQSAIAYLYNADACPTTHAEGTGTSGGSATVAVETFLSPVAGTK